MKCPKCGIEHTNKRPYCSRKCANSRTYTVFSKQKKSIANKNHWKNLSTDEQRQWIERLRKTRTLNMSEFDIKQKRLRTLAETIHKRRIGQIQLWLNGQMSMEKTRDNDRNQYPKRFIREWVEQQHGKKCWTCGWMEVNQTTGNIPVQLNHKNGDPLDNTPSNLELLCPNCHSLTPTWGSYGKGRPNRSKRKVRVA